MSALDKYLRQYAEAEIKLLQHWPAEAHFDHCLVIPAYDESVDFCRRLIPLLQANRALGIVLINRPDSCDNCSANEELQQWLLSAYSLRWQQGSLSLLGDTDRPLENNWGILLADRHRQPIPAKQGVGLARKIGVDLACALFQGGHLNSPWIHSSDADASWPDGYFSVSDKVRDHSALSYAFHHRREDNPVGRATARYEQTLHHYRQGLQRAGSPYAFYTLGSTLAVDANCYAQARGFPKRAGGEDFYLLNKLAKLAPIKSLEHPVIELQPRLSHRVPFGTGPATAKLMQQGDGEVMSYAPAVFDELQQWLVFANRHQYRADAISQHWGELSIPCQTALEQLGADKLTQHLQRHQGKRHFDAWFDGFRTLRFIHILQEHFYPPEPLAAG